MVRRTQTDLYSVDCDHEAEGETDFDEAASARENVYPDLTFEFGPRAEKTEFVISAAGIKDEFPVVLALARAAPPLARWQISQFRPRQEPTDSGEVGDDRIDPNDDQFSPLDNGR